MSPEMQALYRHTISDPMLSAMFRQRATDNAANLIASLFNDKPSDEQAEQIIANLERSAPRGKILSEDTKSAIRGLVGNTMHYPSARLSDEQISQLSKPKTFPEIRETLRAVLRGRQMTVTELSKMPLFSRLKKTARRELIRQNLYRMERDEQAQRVGSRGRSSIWGLV